MEQTRKQLQVPAGGFVVGGNILAAVQGGNPQAALAEGLKLVKELRLVDHLGKLSTAVPDAQGFFQLPYVPAAVPGKYGVLNIGDKAANPVKIQVGGAYDLGAVKVSEAGADASSNPLEQIDSDGDGQKDAQDADDGGDDELDTRSDAEKEEDAKPDEIDCTDPIQTEKYPEDCAE